VVGYIIITLFQIACRVCQYKNFENGSIIGEDINKSSAHPIQYSVDSGLLDLLPAGQHHCVFFVDCNSHEQLIGQFCKCYRKSTG